MNMCHQVFVKACQKQARAEIRHEMKMVPRRPKALFMGSVSQQPKTAQQRYGAPFTRPTSQVSRSLLVPIPKACL
jgi:hypothetical protein